MDAGGFVWLWQGWWPAKVEGEEDDGSSEAATTGSALLRFNFARRAALQTALDYHNCLKKEAKVSGGGMCYGIGSVTCANAGTVTLYL